MNNVTPVGNYEDGKSPYGVYDMAGNVEEWTASWFGIHLGNEIYSEPIFFDKNFNLEFQKYEYVVGRGGMWGDDLFAVRSTSRKRLDPSEAYDYVGFRCARNISSSSESVLTTTTAFAQDHLLNATSYAVTATAFCQPREETPVPITPHDAFMATADALYQFDPEFATESAIKEIEHTAIALQCQATVTPTP